MSNSSTAVFYNPQKHTVKLYVSQQVDGLTVDEAKALHEQLDRAITEAFKHDALCHPTKEASSYPGPVVAAVERERESAAVHTQPDHHHLI